MESKVGSAIRVRLCCTSCREPSPKVSVLSTLDERVPIPGSKGEAHLVQRCACKAVATVEVVRHHTAPLDAAALAAGAPLCVLECRGCEPCAWVAGDGWGVAGLASGAWEASFLEEDTFSEYDEVAGAVVEVGGLRGEWRKS